jgi:hypothetical protein
MRDTLAPLQDSLGLVRFESDELLLAGKGLRGVARCNQ